MVSVDVKHHVYLAPYLSKMVMMATAYELFRRVCVCVFVEENKSLHVVDTMILGLWKAVLSLSTRREVLCFTALKICLWTVSLSGA